MRTHRAGELRPDHIGEQVTLCGWVASRRDHGGVVFIDLRDVEGLVQVVIDPSSTSGVDPHTLRAEFVLRVEGTVRERPEGTVNPALPTGEIEVVARAVEVLNEAAPPPIPIDERTEADEVLRLRYRYLDLRGERLQRNLRMRAVVNRVLRSELDERGFVEVNRAASMRSHRARSCSSSCSWSEASIATTRSRDVCATRTLAQTVSRASSHSSTSR